MIEFQYFEGCPNAVQTLVNLRKAMVDLDIPESQLRITEVPDQAAGEKCDFQGSPTVLKEGVDIATGARPVGCHYTCRVYDIDGKKTGVLPREWLKIRLKG